MSRRYLNAGEWVSTYDSGSWQRVVFAEFEAALSSESRPFPCIFGVAGFRQDQLRYRALEQLEVDELGDALATFVANARSYGPNTSLVVFTRPGPIQSIEAYRTLFWSILVGLTRYDPAPWPAGIAQDLDHPQWEFCFAGEPIFVVCNTPAHVARQSRRASSLMLTFQPRWVFEKILSTPRAAAGAIGSVRQRLAPYDLVSASPDLGLYGEADTREFRQYFLNDHNASPGCPFRTLAPFRNPAPPLLVA